MARVSMYLNTLGRTEEQFRFYGAIFGIELEILGGTVLMGTDLLRSRGHDLLIGNNVSINLEPDTLDEGRRLFEALSDGATEVSPFQKMFWGDHWGSLLDRYGIRWMVNVPDPEA